MQVNASTIITKIRETAGEETANEVAELLRTRRIEPGLSRSAAAAALGLTVDGLDQLHAKGLGPPRCRVGTRRWVYPGKQFNEWLEQRLAAENA